MLRCELQEKVEISCVWHVHRNLQDNFEKIRQSEPVFCSQEISSWRRKSCKQFPPGALQVAKKYCERVTPPLQIAMIFSRHRCETIKAMLHEAIFLATFCCETSCNKDFKYNTPLLQPATATKCCVASCKKSRNILCVTCPSKPARQFCEA